MFFYVHYFIWFCFTLLFYFVLSYFVLFYLILFYYILFYFISFYFILFYFIKLKIKNKKQHSWIPIYTPHYKNEDERIEAQEANNTVGPNQIRGHGGRHKLHGGRHDVTVRFIFFTIYTLFNLFKPILFFSQLHKNS